MVFALSTALNSRSFPTRIALPLLSASFLLAACQPKEQRSRESGPPESVNAQETGSASEFGSATAAPPVLRHGPPLLWKEFSGDKAFEEVRQQVEIGPRPAASEELEKARGFIESSLRRAGWKVERQVFTSETPSGNVEFINLIARFPATPGKPAVDTTQRAIVCSHYDTKRFSTIRFVGASDGASSTGALLELARVAAQAPAFAAQLELVFFDGEEAFVQFTETDGLYGSRYYAERLHESKRAGQFRFGVLLDMIGDAHLSITLSPDSPADLVRDVFAAADTIQARDKFDYFDRSIYDDHRPLINVAHIPTIDLIDFDYPPWHTADDTLDKLSPQSLQTVGRVTLYLLENRLGN